jgi:hypothetical protein
MRVELGRQKHSCTVFVRKLLVNGEVDILWEQEMDGTGS